MPVNQLGAPERGITLHGVGDSKRGACSILMPLVLCEGCRENLSDVDIYF